jgi:hypothetical protein
MKESAGGVVAGEKTGQEAGEEVVTQDYQFEPEVPMAKA